MRLNRNKARKKQRHAKLLNRFRGRNKQIKMYSLIDPTHFHCFKWKLFSTNVIHLLFDFNETKAWFC